MSSNVHKKAAALEGAPFPSPTPVERLTTIEGDLANLNELLEHLWLERHMLYSAISDVRVVRRQIELLKVRLAASDGGGA